MRKVIASLLIALVLSSCSFYTSIMQNVSGNPFMPSYKLSEPLPEHNLFESSAANPENPPEGEDGSEQGPSNGSAQREPLSDSPAEFTFPLFSDPHIGRGDSGVTGHNDEFLAFLKANTGIYPFVVCLGDLIDNGDIYSKELVDFIESTRKETTLRNFVYVIGNHDVRTGSKSAWDERFKVLTPGHDVSRMIRYSYNGVSIYKLDNSSRIFGKEQLNMLEEALRNDPNKYRIFLAHEIVASGGALDQTTVIFGAEPGELLRLYSMMDKYGVSMLFTGHHHKGNIIYEGKTFAEFNAAALHSRSGSFESDGYWYTVTVSPESSTIKVTTYAVADDEAEPWKEVSTRNFTLRAADEVGKEEEDTTTPAGPGEGSGTEENPGTTTPSEDNPEQEPSPDLT